MKSSLLSWTGVALCSVLALAGCASSGGGSTGAGGGGSAGGGASGSEGAATVHHWPSPSAYDYRPESPNIDLEAQASKPPAWFMVVALIEDANSRETVADQDRTWAARHDRASLLRQKHTALKDRWAWERENNKVVIVPRNVTADLQPDQPPEWAREVAGIFMDTAVWTRATEEVRRRELESAALQEARYAYMDRTNEYAVHKADTERAARLDAEQQRKREQEEGARQREQQAREARAKYERLQAEKVSQVEEQPVGLQDLMSKPAEFKGRTIKVRGHWHESVGRGMHLDALGGAPVLIIGVTPPGRREPQAMLALDLKDYQDRITFFEPLPAKTRLESGASVELTVFVLGDPLDPQLPCLGRILSTRVE